MLFEMITGKLPFESRDYEALFNLILTQEVQFPGDMSDEAQVRRLAPRCPCSLRHAAANSRIYPHKRGRT